MKNFNFIYKSIFVFALLIFAFGCDSLVQVVPESKLPKIEQKLALFCFISPQDTVLYAKLTKSTPVFSKDSIDPRFLGFWGQSQNGEYLSPDNVKDGSITISDGVNIGEFKYDKSNGIFTIPTKNFKILPGKTYTLIGKGLGKEVSATCTVPFDNIPITSVKIDTVSEKSSFSSDTLKYIKIFIKWKDDASKINYYDVNAKYFGFIESYQYDPILKTGKYQISNHDLKFYWNSNKVQSDIGSNGQTMISNEGELYIANLNRSGTNVDGKFYPFKPTTLPSFINFELYNIDEAYFKFNTSLYRNGNNPFAEPTLIYNNVKGGLGCFAAYNKSILRLSTK